MECRYVKPIKEENAIRLFQEREGIRFDVAYVEFIKSNNGGRPEKNVVTLRNGSEKVVNKFLSFNESDTENIYRARKRVKEDGESLIPFAADPSGNYFCFKDTNVFYYDHERGECQYTADSFREFINMLEK